MQNQSSKIKWTTDVPPVQDPGSSAGGTPFYDSKNIAPKCVIGLDRDGVITIPLKTNDKGYAPRTMSEFNFYDKSDFSIKHLIDAAKMISDAVDNKTPPTCNMGGPQWCAGCEGYDD